MSKKIFGRALGAGFALATATALVLPGVASAADEEGSGSLSSLSGEGPSESLPGLDLFKCIFDNVGSADDEGEDEDQNGEATGSLEFGSILECFTSGSAGDDDEDEEVTA